MQFHDRRVNYLLMAAIYAYVLENPGCRQKHIADAFALHRSSLLNKLTVLECCGFLLVEDDNEQLYPFGISSA